MPILSRDEAFTNLKDNVLKSLETAGGFGQGSSEPEQNVLTPFPKFTSARTMLAFVVSTCMRHLLLPLLRAVLRWEQFQLDQESCRLPGFVSWELRTNALQELTDLQSPGESVTWDYPQLHLCMSLVDHVHGLCLESTYSLLQAIIPNQLQSIMNIHGYDAD